MRVGMLTWFRGKNANDETHADAEAEVVQDEAASERGVA